MRTSRELDAIARNLVDCSFQVHKNLGPGLLESIYQRALAHELAKRNIDVRCAVPLPILYDGVDLGIGYQLDMIIEGTIIVENKAVQELHPVHHAQLLTYLRLTNSRLGFLINWNVPLIKSGIKRMVNGL